MAQTPEKPVEKPSPQQRVTACKIEVEKSLKKHNCLLLSAPEWKPRDDGTYSLITTIKINPS